MELQSTWEESQKNKREVPLAQRAMSLAWQGLLGCTHDGNLVIASQLSWDQAVI